MQRRLFSNWGRASIGDLLSCCRRCQCLMLCGGVGSQPGRMREEREGTAKFLAASARYGGWQRECAVCVHHARSFAQRHTRASTWRARSAALIAVGADMCVRMPLRGEGAHSLSHRRRFWGLGMLDRRRDQPNTSCLAQSAFCATPTSELEFGSPHPQRSCRRARMYGRRQAHARTRMRWESTYATWSGHVVGWLVMVETERMPPSHCQ